MLFLKWFMATHIIQQIDQAFDIGTIIFAVWLIYIPYVHLFCSVKQKFLY